MNEMTPMLRQFVDTKSAYPDCILFFRMGDFYEMFFEDAEKASKILGITLTSRGSFNGSKVPMCGVPHHSSRSYIAKLIENGCKVAVCEQVEDPKQAKGIVKRDVVRVITPGSVVAELDIEGGRNLYMAAVCGGDSVYGLAHVDLSTGDFRVTEVRERRELFDELGRIDPAEVLIYDTDPLKENRELTRYRVELLKGPEYERGRSEQILKDQLGVKSLAGFGCEGMKEGIIAAGAIAQYLKETQKGNPDHIKEISAYHLGDYMFLDESTTLSLELFETIRRRSSKGSLFRVIDRTITPMGARLLKRWIGYPLVDINRIKNRLAAVSNFHEDRLFREDIRENLEGIYDLERLNGKVSLARANARDLIALKASIYKLPLIKERLNGAISDLLSEISNSLDTLDDIAQIIETAINEDPPVSIKEGGLIREGYNPELDELISMTRHGKKWINELERKEQERTGIPKLKIGFNKVFGYFIEITKSNVHLVPGDYIRKQTLVNCERYITESLKEYEDKVMGAEERRIELEFSIFEQIRERIALENHRIKDTASKIGEIDVLAGLAEVSELNNYVCPEVNEEGVIHITDGRHPVIEQTVKEEDFVPNDIFLNDTDQQIMIITGPNMAGKSTILRQTALMVLMAQMGCFVPASKAVIGIVDRIFTRIGASDDITRGQSTFMVEMDETANILRHATPKSLVILDEIGRGTSTYDGLSIAWAVAEALHDLENKGVRTIFATHYHEITELLSAKSRVKNFNIAVREWKDRIIFLRKMVPGSTSRSYGIQVARIAGIPEKVIDRAKEILNNLENEDLDDLGRPKIARSNVKPGKNEGVQLSLFGNNESRVIRMIKELNTAGITPLEALIELDKLKKIVDGLQ
jgi:DNA mismatch repair protein MutS